MKESFCTSCGRTVDLPENIEVNEPYCEPCFEKTFGSAMMDNAMNEAKEE